ncbi:MAG: DsbA family oxidoreductase [Myxococcota bacterium]
MTILPPPRSRRCLQSPPLERVVRVDVWSDVVCPWCYIGKRRLEAALERFPHRDGVEVVFHSFELDPSAPRDSATSLVDMLATKYGMSRAKAEEMQRSVTAVAAEDGLDFHLDEAAPANTFDAHRLLHLAKARGKQEAVKEALFAAYFTEGRKVGETATLVEVGVGAGLPEADVRAVVADASAYAAEVRADENTARQYGIRGVPFFVLDEKYGISGAQPADALLAALSRAWSERPVDLAPAAACEDDACEVPPKAD